MDLELYSLLSTVIAIATGATVIFALLAYMLFRVRERRGAPSKPAAKAMVKAAASEIETEAAAPRFFKRYEPAGDYELPKN